MEKTTKIGKDGKEHAYWHITEAEKQKAKERRQKAREAEVQEESK